MDRIYGADVDMLRDLASRFAHAADRLRATRNQVTREIQATAWLGPAFLRFRDEWDSVNGVRLESAAQLLAESAAVLRRNADEQEKASGGGSFNSTSLPQPFSAGPAAMRHEEI